jgi:hypothetical protein
MARYTEQKAIVSTTNHGLKLWLLLIVATPKNMKMTVSEELLNIFIAYLTVVWDLWEMLDST